MVQNVSEFGDSPTEGAQTLWPERLAYDADLANAKFLCSLKYAAQHDTCDRRRSAVAAQCRTDEETRPFEDVGRPRRSVRRQPWKDIAEQVGLQRRDKARPADDLAEAVQRHQVNCVFGVERIHLNIDGSRHGAPLSPFHVNVVANAKIPLQNDPVLFSIGPSDHLYSNHDASRRREVGQRPLDPLCRDSGIAKFEFRASAAPLRSHGRH